MRRISWTNEYSSSLYLSNSSVVITRMSFGTLIPATATRIGTGLRCGGSSVSITTRISRSLYSSASCLATEPNTMIFSGENSSTILPTVSSTSE